MLVEQRRFPGLVVPGGVVIGKAVKSAGGFTPTPPPSGYADAVLADTPELYWRLAETSGTTAEDATANNRDGTYDGSVTLGQTSLVGDAADKAVLLTGGQLVSAWVTFPASNESRTFEIVAKRTGGASVDTLVGTSGGGGSNGRLVINASSNDVLLVSGTGASVTWTAAWPGLDVAVHVAAYVNMGTNTHELFINGVSQGTKVLGNFAGPSSVFKAGGHGTFTSDPFEGTIDEVAAYAGALSSARILAHAQAAGLA